LEGLQGWGIRQRQNGHFAFEQSDCGLSRFVSNNEHCAEGGDLVIAGGYDEWACGIVGDFEVRFAAF
jgi:hypothetical protein